MAKSILSRYIDAEVLGKVQGTPVKPRGLVMGNLAGAHKSPLHGFAVEFAGHREYVIGDDTRHIDWRVFYKRDKYFIKQYEMETNFTAHLVLDVSASMRYGEEQEQKMLYAAQMLTTLGYSIIKQSDRVSLSTFDEKICGYVPPGNSMAQVQRMTEHLDEIEPKEKTDMSECLSEVAGRTGRREIIMIFSDFFTDLDELEKVLQRLRYQQHEVVLFQVLHHDELAFNFDGMIKFIGLEVPDEILMQPSELRKAYLAALNRFNDRFEEICQANKVERLLVDTSTGMGEFLFDYLNTRGLVRRAV
ncbi:MAG: DUF58 domain-containing protein [Planctomycetota bacterium]|nr:DUF58 domain-containing protein [Planctomycetota bacterium]MEE3295851.1 DUF58 domain-containing protein [Planctomycetota bacterium]|tara:strand:- start:343 stop:1251 length:909 start_codon:yes stop_codon:yes gene_type:complete